mgnify:CR=1 FL=1
MGLFDFLRKQYRKVIQWENDNPQSIVWKYPLERKEEIMRNSVLVVREGQKAMFIQEGKLADVFGPGTYKLEDIKNIPLLTALYNWKYFWETPYTGDIYFISTKQFIDNKWGTSNPVMMRDKEFGMVRVRGFGVYSFSVGTPTAAMNELFGSMGELTVKDVDDYFKKIIVSELSTAIAESGIPAIDLAMHYDELSDITRQKMAEDFAKIGIEIDALYIENISLPEEVEKMMDKRTSVGVMGGAMQGYAQMQAVEAMRDAAKNPGGLAGAGVGVGAGLGIGKMFADNMSGIGEDDGKATCPHCGAKVKKSAKFCPECGKPMVETVECPSCHKQVKKGAKFCPECGASLVAKCPKCGKEVKPGAKFCPECGEKLS